MTENDRYQLTVLAEAEHMARQRYECLRAMSVETDPEKARARAIEYVLAETELMEASRQLRLAQYAIVGP